MSAENLEIVREAINAFVARDMERVAGVYDPDAAITAVPDGWPEPAPVVGRDAVIRQFERLQEDWEQQSLDIERHMVEGDWVVVALRWVTQGAGSGLSFDTTIIAAYRLEHVRIVEARFYWDLDEALAAVAASGGANRSL
jgi:ketosteroid isomerase-like protein